jgi:hypothetical protein
MTLFPIDPTRIAANSARRTTMTTYCLLFKCNNIPHYLTPKNIKSHKILKRHLEQFPTKNILLPVTLSRNPFLLKKESIFSNINKGI